MDIGSIFLILGLLLLVALFVARPILERTATAVTQEEHEVSALLAERDRVLNALQELDFDFALGKIPEADYPDQRAALLQQGANLLRQLDLRQANARQPEARPAPAAGEVEARIEAAIAARRADTGPRLETQAPLPTNGGALEGHVPAGAGVNGVPRLVVAAPDDDLEALIASRRRERSEKTAGFCPQCGRAVQKSDRFCPKCGVTLI
jgi:hypothetical protein